MNLKNLTTEELLTIDGGNQDAYDAGYAAGQHVRAAAETVGNIISWCADIIDKVVPG
ncbi:hypothetical protein KUL156_49530 [Alteromonas sp. KUL156]|nr:hypothetical protein KUL154_02190 [Alteromonas sp. KUL154]GFE02361.1 hypothetical protein KUL156_49530 [Alteromonas sp. KUL156]